MKAGVSNSAVGQVKCAATGKAVGVMQIKFHHQLLKLTGIIYFLNTAQYSLRPTSTSTSYFCAFTILIAVATSVPSQPGCPADQRVADLGDIAECLHIFFRHLEIDCLHATG